MGLEVLCNYMNIIYYVFDVVNRLMAPYIPFMTEKVYLEIHHKRYPARSADDLITVCKPCHHVITGYVRRHRASGSIYSGLVLEDTYATKKARRFALAAER